MNQVRQDPPVRPSIRLVVITTDPGALQSWLSPEARAAVLLVAASAPRTTAENGAGGLVATDLIDSEWALVHLPLDGPVSALGLAARSIQLELGDAAPTTAVLLESDPPPSPAALREVAGALTPAVDLTEVLWATSDRVWLAGADGIASFRHDVTDHESAIELAEAMCSLGLLRSDGPIDEWLHDVIRGRVQPSAALWDEVLGAGYVESLVEAVTDPGHRADGVGL